MDPVVLATVTSAVSVMAGEAGKGLLSAAGKDVWAKIKTLFNWSEPPAPAELSQSVATKLAANPQLAQQVIELLQQPGTGLSGGLVGSISAEKVVVIGTFHGRDVKF